MNRRWKSILSLLLILTLALGMMPAQAADTAPAEMQSGNLAAEKPSIADIQEKYQTVTTAETCFDEEPSATAPYALGKLSQSFLDSGVTYLNYIRYLAGLPEVQLSDEKNTAAQYGAVLLAANDTMTHYPDQPEDMDDAFYNAGYAAASSSNLCTQWSNGDALDVLQSALSSMMTDSSTTNAAIVGHRRWLLNPKLLYTGFGYAEAAVRSGNTYYRTYVDIPVFDRSGAALDYDFVAWPASGYMPVQEFSTDSPWSISLNPEKYAPLDRDAISVTITRVEDGKSYTFSSDTASTASSGGPFFVTAARGYGEGEALIFRATTSYFGSNCYTLGEYDVTVTGLKDLAGNDAALTYRVTFFDVETGSVGREINVCSVGLSVDGAWWPSDGTVYYTYDGTAKEPYVRVFDSGKLLMQDVDYTVTYQNNLNYGTATATITGIGDYRGEKTVSFSISKCTPTVRLSHGAASADYDLRVGNTLQFNAAVTIPTDDVLMITFTSDSPEVATVDQNGLVTAHSAGETLIHATTTPTENYAQSTTFIKLVVIDKETPNLEFSSDVVTKTYGDARFYNSFSDVHSGARTYTSSNEGVATVTSSGIVTITGVGTTTITVNAAEDGTYAAGSNRYTLIVGKAAQSLTATLPADSIPTGSTARITTTGAVGPLHYKSSDTAVATVDENGVVTGVAPGIATITVTADGDEAHESATVEVTAVVAVPVPESITITPASLTLNHGAHATLAVTIFPSNAAGALTWHSTNTGVATVDESGGITALAAGSATITATTANGKTASCVVTVVHQYTDPIFQWGADYAWCTATFPCSGCNLQQTLSCAISNSTVPTTCAEAGSTTYHATVTFGDQSYSADETVPIAALAHTYGAPVFRWTTDYSACTAVFTCSVCGATETVTCTVTTQTETDRIVYTAVCTLNGISYQDVQTVAVTPVDPEPPEPPVVTIDPCTVFTDVSHDWAYAGIEYCYNHGLMAGTSNTTFSPDDALTRGQFVAILWRQLGCPAPKGENPFTDLTQNYYKDAITWAAENKVVYGTSETTFDPDRAITRQELTTMFYRYVRDYLKQDVSGTADVTGFPDYGKVADYACEAMAWAKGVGLISGNEIGGTIYLDPLGAATRAQAATMFMNLCERVLK